jgi:hypothetical protein
VTANYEKRLFFFTPPLDHKLTGNTVFCAGRVPLWPFLILAIAAVEDNSEYGLEKAIAAHKIKTQTTVHSGSIESQIYFSRIIFTQTSTAHNFLSVITPVQYTL